MGVNAFLLMSLALASQFMLALADNDTVCTYEGQRFRLDRQGQLPLKTHYNCYTEIECKEKCDAKSTCIIWQWQPTRRICWIMDVVPYPDRNSDFGINNCDNGKPTENAPLCVVTKGDRNNVWQDYRDMTKEDCQVECILDSDCIIWQHIKNKKLCRIHKLEIDISKKSQVGLHYCSTSKPSTTSPTTTTTPTSSNTNETLSCPLSRGPTSTSGGGGGGNCARTCVNADFVKKYICNDCNMSPTKAAKHATKVLAEQKNLPKTFMVIEPEPGKKISWKGENGGECTGNGKILVYKCKLITNSKNYECSIHPSYIYTRLETCDIHTNGERLTAVNCEINREWLEVYPKQGSAYCRSKIFKYFSINKLNEQQALNYVNLRTDVKDDDEYVIIYHQAEAQNVEWTKESNDVCFHKEIFQFWMSNKLKCFAPVAPQGCEFRHSVKTGKLESVICPTSSGGKKQVFPGETCDPETEEGDPFIAFKNKHWCKDCKQDIDKANRHSRWRVKNKRTDFNTVISLEPNTQVSWSKDKSGEFCIGRGKMFLFRCLLIEDTIITDGQIGENSKTRYECDKMKNFPSKYQDCAVKFKIDTGHLEKIQCTTETVTELQIYPQLHKCSSNCWN